MALSNVLAQAGHAPEKLDVEAVATFLKVEAGWRLTTMALSVTGSVPGMSSDEFAEAAAAAKDGCPVSNALKGNVEITAEAILA
jgi:osmotically inducible protein OsmC